jgi:hypothetical protein
MKAKVCPCLDAENGTYRFCVRLNQGKWYSGWGLYLEEHVNCSGHSRYETFYFKTHKLAKEAVVKQFGERVRFVGWEGY